jgi:DNA adenine methylase
MENLLKILDKYTIEAEKAKKQYILENDIYSKIELVCSDIRIKAPIRFLLSCCAAKIDNPDIDIRKPYTEIKGNDTFSGRSYDEKYIQQIIEKYNLPCNSTTAYLTPAFRNRNTIMLPDTELVGRNPELYKTALELLELTYRKTISPEQLFKEIVRQLFIIRNQNSGRIEQLIKSLKGNTAENHLSSEQIVTLLTQHLASKNSSRLPVLVVASAYQTVSDLIGENIKPLQAHNAADKQTGAFGDIEVVLQTENDVVTSYEMKDKRVTKSDIEIALKKIAQSKIKIDNYIFITTDVIEKEVEEYAKTFYDNTGIEIAILDCIGFIKHFLHFFHRRRTEFLEKYQELVLSEPNSSVNQPLKEAFLALRQAAETDK